MVATKIGGGEGAGVGVTVYEWERGGTGYFVHAHISLTVPYLYMKRPLLKWKNKHDVK
jgi:hypothetical protein